ncbi:MAG: hypothetical protein IPL33_19945 [Sphingobacteriales bacterium]|nr:hypothetical protein [Sphingobacteriales bacterium]
MKKILILLSFTLLWVACQKDNELSNEPSSLKTSYELSEVINLNAETKRLADVLQNNKFTVGAIANANFGSLPLDIAYYVSGKTPANISINLQNKTYTPTAEGQYMQEYSPELNTIWGSQQTFQISDGSNTQSYSLYVPKTITMNKLLHDQSLNISRAGNNLTWQADPNNASKLVMLQCRVYNQIENEGDIIEDKILFLPDNGSYNIDHLLTNPNAKSIFLMITRGTAVDFVSQEGKINFRFQANDAHYYNLP